MTFRDLCIIRAALYHLAAQQAVPANVYDVATNAGQFVVKPADAEAVADKLEDAVFAERLIGNLRPSDTAALEGLLASQIPEGRPDRQSHTRQRRFIERLCGYFAQREGGQPSR